MKTHTNPDRSTVQVPDDTVIGHHVTIGDESVIPHNSEVIA